MKLVRARLNLSLIVGCLAWFVQAPTEVCGEDNLTSQRASSPPSATTDFDFFEKKIRPVLVEHCYECHASDAKTIKGGLLLDSRDAMRNGGESGVGIDLDDPSESLILQALRYESFEMPPQGQLPAQIVRDFETWIEAGAADPRDATTSITRDEIDIEQGRQFWSFQPRADAVPPDVQDDAWPESPVDLFIRSRQEAEGIAPVSDASRSELLRRASYALIGLPPTPEEIEAFLADPADDQVAFARVVDRLLESHHFGERWGRRWLDVVRFAESSGGGRTLLFPDAWRYRDYVIDAFNSDMPFDQFVREQIAGDLLAANVPTADWQTRQRLITATSFLVLGPTNYELQDKDILEMDIVDEQLDTIGKAFLGQTIGCARCHDHKFDPIPTADYYAMAGILKGTKSVIHSNVSTWNTVDLPVSPNEENKLRVHETLLKQLQAELDSLKKSKKLADDKKDKSAVKQWAAKIKRLEKKIRTAKTKGPVRPKAMATIDLKSPRDIPVSIRGVVHNPGKVVPRGVLQVVTTNTDLRGINPDESGRLRMADWLADPTNPLTARVFVNRVWAWLFGEGIVRTVDNFGSMGDLPTHPELLDYLTNEFVSDGQSVKRLIRRLMLSHAYRLSSMHQEAATEKDVANKLLWRMHRHRIEAESIRDTLLLLAGTLDLRVGGPSIKPGTKIEYDYVFDLTRRSVYVPVFRNTLPSLFETFDFADPNIQMGKRTSSTTAPQALLLMNDPFVLEQCEATGRRVTKHAGVLREKIEQSFLEVLCRKPTVDELETALEFMNGDEGARAWALLYQTLIQSVDFRYIH